MKALRPVFSPEQVGGIAGSAIWFGLWLCLLMVPMFGEYFRHDNIWPKLVFAVGGAVGLKLSGEFGARVGGALRIRFMRRQSP